MKSMLLRKGIGGEQGLMEEVRVDHYKQLLKDSPTHLMNFKPHSFRSTIYCTPMIYFCGTPFHGGAVPLPIMHGSSQQDSSFLQPSFRCKIGES